MTLAMEQVGPQSKPLDVFRQWMADAKSHPHIKEANAMALATLGADGELHNRVVLCKGWSEDGLVFFTNYDSRKGRDLTANPKTAVVFYWDPMFRQVKVSGRVQKTSRQVSEDYWRTRPRESQISQYVSRQSQPAPERDVLENDWKAAEAKLAGQDIACPENWGGYLIVPERWEFWIGRPGRFHDRFEFEKSSGGWTFRRLYP